MLDPLFTEGLTTEQSHMIPQIPPESDNCDMCFNHDLFWIRKRLSIFWPLMYPTKSEGGDMDEGNPPIVLFDLSLGYFLNFKGMIGLYLQTRYIGIGLSQYNLTVTGNAVQSHPFKL